LRAHRPLTANLSPCRRRLRPSAERGKSLITGIGENFEAPHFSSFSTKSADSGNLTAAGPLQSINNAFGVRLRKTPQPVFTVRGHLLGDCTSERALELKE
jgi:hypothetical protein